jgi:hypothetical protein
MTKKPEHKKAVAGQNGNSGRGTPIEVPETTYQLPPEDLHVARLIRVIDLGTHHSNFADGKKQRRVMLTWELPNERTTFTEEKGEELFTQSKFYTLSLGQRSNLFKDLSSWVGKGAIETVRHNLALLLGKVCMLNIVHKEKKNGQKRAEVIAVTPLLRGTRVPEQINPSLSYSILDGMGGAYDDLPQGIQKLIATSEEIGGARPSLAEITERNVLQATANAQEPHRPVKISEPTSTDPDEDALNAELAGVTANGGEEVPF